MGHYWRQTGFPIILRILLLMCRTVADAIHFDPDGLDSSVYFGI
jgi:hypothetical protein